MGELDPEGRSPCGERGLKSFSAVSWVFRSVSLPVRGAWIEIRSPGCIVRRPVVAPRAGSVD